MSKHPNVIYVFSDQHRWEATGYAGNSDVQTPTMDRLAGESICFDHAVANAPVCGPARASLLTGQRSLTNGVFVNDVQLNPDARTIGKVFSENGYDTAYIGKWHLDGRGRMSYIPKERRQGFDFWRANECSHNYNNSPYYGDEPQKTTWEGYDAFAQAQCAADYIRTHDPKNPFVMILSWGPPHSPYHTAPQKYRDLYDENKLLVRDNVPSQLEREVRHTLAGYYAHISALDACLETVWESISEAGIEDDTIFIYTSDHGDMLGSQGHFNKQRPWDESIRVPFLLHYPKMFGKTPRHFTSLFSTIDIMPTLLELCSLPIPETVEGDSVARYLDRGLCNRSAVLIECVHPFGQWTKQDGGKEYRGIRTERFTYVRDLNGPWLLYDNFEDPFQLHNLISSFEYRDKLNELDADLWALLSRYNDSFLPGESYVEQWGYEVDETGTMPYEGYDPEGE